MKQHYNIQNNITIQYNKTENDIVTYKEYCDTKKQHNKTQKTIQNNILLFNWSVKN